MKRLTFYSLLTTLIIIYSINAQSIRELRIVDKAKHLPNQIIDNEIKDGNGEICAGLMILSDINGLTYDSNNGVVKINHNNGEDLLFLSPTERVVKIYGPGYIPLQVILNDIGINLKSGQVWQIKVTGDKKLDLIPINILTEPTNVNIRIDGVDRSSLSSLYVFKRFRTKIVNI